jgi:hypothetical protein
MVSEQTREWKEPRVRELYSMAITSRDGPVHREILAILGAMERAGSKDAEWALSALRKKKE